MKRWSKLNSSNNEFVRLLTILTTKQMINRRLTSKLTCRELTERSWPFPRNQTKRLSSPMNSSFPFKLTNEQHSTFHLLLLHWSQIDSIRRIERLRTNHSGNATSVPNRSFPSAWHFCPVLWPTLSFGPTNTHSNHRLSDLCRSSTRIVTRLRSSLFDDKYLNIFLFIHSYTFSQIVLSKWSMFVKCATWATRQINKSKRFSIERLLNNHCNDIWVFDGDILHEKEIDFDGNNDVLSHRW